MTASGAIDAAVEAVARALFKATNGARMYYDPPTWDEISESNKESWRYSAKVAVEAAAPVLLAAERDRIAARIEAELVCCDLYERIDACGPDQKAVGDLIRDSREKYEYHAICHWGGYAAAIARGSAAGKPDTQGGQ